MQNFEEFEDKPTVIRWIYVAIAAIDRGTFFREPMVWLYRALGVLSVISPVLLLFSGGFAARMYGGLPLYGPSAFFTVIAVIFAIAAWAFGIVFWFRRANTLHDVIADGNSMPVLTLVAHLVQTLHEYVGIAVMVFYPVYLLFHGLIGQLFLPGVGYLNVLLVSILLAAVSVIAGYVIVLVGHYLGELIKAIAIIASNAQSIGDIMRHGSSPTPSVDDTQEAAPQAVTETAEASEEAGVAE